jgi:hypothetical protein
MRSCWFAGALRRRGIEESRTINVRGHEPLYIIYNMR